jgi:hypothetical protein
VPVCGSLAQQSSAAADAAAVVDVEAVGIAGIVVAEEPDLHHSIFDEVAGVERTLL